MINNQKINYLSIVIYYNLLKNPFCDPEKPCFGLSKKSCFPVGRIAKRISALSQKNL